MDIDVNDNIIDILTNNEELEINSQPETLDIEIENPELDINILGQNLEIESNASFIYENDHSELTNLDYENSGHIGFASSLNLENKVDKELGKGLSTNDYTTEEKNKLAGLNNYDDTEIKQDILNLETNKADKTEIPTKLSEFTDDLGSNPTHSHYQYLTSHQDISGKEDKSNKSTNTSLGTSNTLYPTQNAVKTYIDNIVGDVESVLEILTSGGGV